MNMLDGVPSFLEGYLRFMDPDYKRGLLAGGETFWS
jgi:hypothetical protein